MPKINAEDDYSQAVNSIGRIKECIDRAYYNLAGIELACDRALDYPFENWTEETLHNFINQIKYLAKVGQNK